MMAVFYLGKISKADEQNPLLLTVTEIMHAPEKDHGDWLEMYVMEDAACNLRASNSQILNFYLCTKKNSDNTCNQTWPVYATTNGCHFKKGGYLILTNKPDDFINTDTSTVLKLSSSFNLLSNADAFVAYSDNNKETWQENISYNAFLNKQKGYSLEKDTSKNTWHESCVLGGSPGQKNSTEEDCKSNDDDNSSGDDNTNDTPAKSDYTGHVTIHEIYPSPNTKANEEEFVEIKNNSGKEINFSTWCLKDKTEDDKGKSGSCKKITAKENSGDFFVLYGTFSLNNDSRGDMVFLYDNNNNLVDSRAYTSPKSAYAYAFDSSIWRWTSQATPGQENAFDKILSGKISKDDKIYPNIYASFEVKADRDAQRFTWDFGDGHKSYLQKTRHKYEKTGTYAASLKITGNGEDVLYSFDVEVKKYVAPKVRIVKISPNPKGSDTENEWLEIENNSKKKINLKGWSIATGWNNLVNHPIREDFKIGAGKIKKLLRDICAFTLTNAKDKLELRDPSGKAIQKIQYDHGKKSIREEALYQKTDGSNWAWIEPTTAAGTNPVSTPNAKSTEPIAPASIPAIPEIPTADLGKYSIDPTWQKKRDYQIELVNFDTKIKTPIIALPNQPRVLGARTLSTQENYYTFTQNIHQKHWVTTFFETLWLEINSGLNKILNKA